MVINTTRSTANVDSNDFSVMVEWECGTKFLLHFYSIYEVYAWPRYGKTKLRGKRPFYLTIDDDPQYKGIDARAAWQEVRFKTLMHVCHPRGQVMESSQYMQLCRTHELIGIIPSGNRREIEKFISEQEKFKCPKKK